MTDTTATDGESVVRAYLDAVGALDLAAIEATFADDIELVLPHAPPGSRTATPTSRGSPSATARSLGWRSSSTRSC